jgi:hypothetical protein
MQIQFKSELNFCRFQCRIPYKFYLELNEKNSAASYARVVVLQLSVKQIESIK